MKKELSAALLLLLIFAGGCLNILVTRGITEDICALAERAEYGALAENWQAAENAAEAAIALWENSRFYTHVILHHSEHEGAAETLYGLLSAIYARSAGDTAVAARLVRARFAGIAEMEGFRLESVF